MKKLLTGNEALVQGAWEAGVNFASAYPGTPSTEILENMIERKEVKSEWAPNEKVALEAAIGASIVGLRSMASMKHVGLNVAADPLFTYAYTGVNGGLVIISADEPGQHSSQNEQDNRNYAKAAKIPMLEPASSQEAKDMMKAAFTISETFDTPVLVRVTTRICHSKGIVECGERTEIEFSDYKKDVKKYITVPAIAKELRKKVEERMNALGDYSGESPFNLIYNNGKKVGVISSGICYFYAREVFGNEANYLKLGFTNPLPDKMIADFCKDLDTIYVLEENDPYIEERVKMLGYIPHGNDTFPPYGELTPDVIRRSLYKEEMPTIDYDKSKVISRPPTLCAGCPHRGIFYDLGKRKNVLVAGDIGCYTLGFADPYNAMDFNICMGAGFSAGHGAQIGFDIKKENKRVVSVLGDSTFFHTGINSLIEVLYNQSRTVNLILDNRITGMTGHQENPGTGRHADLSEAPFMDIEAIVKALGAKNVRTIDPNDLALVKDTIDWALGLDEPSVIITRWPCALKKLSQQDKEEFKDVFTEKYEVDADLCIGCKICLKAGCPALSYEPISKKTVIDRTQCVGCGVCAQLCKKQKAIVKEVM
ncbi:indolepyruvate ferredoxin oxidoreductase subunit alpha [Tissierella creatinini]|nr:indolepyruvate ferredoxin oxidoreductase subunit alpha [Tissierella creatinini]TJX61535.1 indolepyruvate ferredoxin oxidoreductase subunit alpha [Soehngenia saccharolytica]